ncbi:uncharacterized protein LOC116120208 [Pistacia vera]|uniref:uncharacterized protein LOC116120208 n=1 Tax=Pistacia vera TaxID=55513 RepID=UPI0012637D34|nr:uncharacterized protein LOC116120208 [Pistacia vera]
MNLDGPRTNGDGHALSGLKFFDGSNYHCWKSRMPIFLQSDHDLWDEMLDGPFVPMKQIVNELPNNANVLSSVAHSSLPTLSIKLGERNYSHWRSQVFPTLTSYELDGFITGVHSFSKARTLHLRNLLQNTKKESMGVNEYILRMKELGDELVANGVQIRDEQLLLYILDGLGPKFDAMEANLVANSSTATL